jgi:UDPglucose 6-dehydrogenase
MEVNESQKLRPVEKLEICLGGLTGKTVGVLGLSFKPGTDDIREAPSIDIIREIIRCGGRVKACDPAAVPNAKRVLPEVEYCENPYSTAQGADALILVTEWQQYRSLDLKRLKGLMKRPVFIDGRNVYDAAFMTGLGFEYLCIGRRGFSHKK